MERARGELLAGARLAADQHDLGVRRQPLDEAEHLLHHRAAAEHAAEFELARHLALERHDLRAALELRADVLEHLPETIEVERLGEVLPRAELDRLDGAVDGRVGGHQDHFAARHGRADLPQQIEPVDVGHPQIDHRQVGGLAQQRAHRVGAARAGDDVEPDARRQPLDDLQHRHFVVDDEQQRTLGLGCGHG